MCWLAHLKGEDQTWWKPLAAAGTVDMITDERVCARIRKTPYMVEQIQRHQALTSVAYLVRPADPQSNRSSRADNEAEGGR